MSTPLDWEPSNDLPPADELAERLLDAAAAGRFAEELDQAIRALDQMRPWENAEDRLRYRVLFFDLAQISTTDRSLQGATAVELLANAGDIGWDVILRSSRIDELRKLSGEPGIGIEIAELLTYAPDIGIRDFAISALEMSGMRLLSSGDDTRSIERLLHASGSSEAAYRLEATRKQRGAENLVRPYQHSATEARIAHRVVAIAGGHAQLRGAAASVLERYGVTVISIPSSQEAVRRERDIVQALRGCELAVLLVRQLTHSTSDQVRKAAGRLGVPVIYSNAASAVAIERQLLELSSRR